MYTFQISVETMADGTFQPMIELKEEVGAKIVFHNYVIPGTCADSETAFEQARLHAIREAKKIGLTDDDFEILVI